MILRSGRKNGVAQVEHKNAKTGKSCANFLITINEGADGVSIMNCDQFTRGLPSISVPMLTGMADGTLILFSCGVPKWNDELVRRRSCRRATVGIWPCRPRQGRRRSAIWRSGTG
jgi:hypothetical protein